MMSTRLTLAPLRKRINTYSFWQDFALVLLGASFVQFWVLTFYYKVDMNLWISWIANDGNAGSPYAFGVHYFGDYLTTHEVAKARDLTRFDFGSYPPLGMIPFWIIAWLPYRLGLLIWFVSLFLSLLLPIVYALRKKTGSISVAGVIAFSFITVASISVFDRGNSVGLLALLFFLFYLCSVRNQTHFAALSLGFAIGIKIYPLVIVPFLLVKKKVKLAFTSLLYAILLNLVAVIIWQREDPFGALAFAARRIIRTEQLSEAGHGMYVSFAQIVVNIINRLGLQDSYFGNAAIAHYHYVTLAIYLLLLLGAKKTASNHWYIFALSSIQLIPTIAFSYYRVWAIAAVAIVILEGRSANGKIELSRIGSIWMFLCVANLTPLTLLNFWPINVFPTVLAFGVVGLAIFQSVSPIYMRIVGKLR
jgi:hypothetical protein